MRRATYVLVLIAAVIWAEQGLVDGRTISQFTFADLIESEERDHFRLAGIADPSSLAGRVQELNEIESLLNMNNNNNSNNRASDSNNASSSFASESLAQANSRKHTLFTATTAHLAQSSLGGSNMNTSTKMTDSSTPLDGVAQNLTPAIEDPSDEQLAKMEQTQSQNIVPSASSEDQIPLETKKSHQVLDAGPKLEKANEPVAKEADPKPKVDKAGQMAAGCDDSVDDGIMNCELGKNPIRMESINAKAIEAAVEKRPFYEIAFFYGIVLSILIILVLVVSKFRESSSKYLEKYYVKSLRVIIVDIIALMTLNAVVQILYYNRILDVVQLEYFNIYGFTIMFSFFGMAWILIAVGYAFILQSFSNSYSRYEQNWPRRRDFLVPEGGEEDDQETDKAYEERVRNIQYFLIKEDFVMPISHIVYTEPMVLREDFNFAEYLGRVQAKSHLQMFNISLTTLIVLMVFFLLVCVIDLIDNWLIECLLMLALPLLSFAVAWAENRRQFYIITQLMNLIVNSYEIDVQKFLNLDLKKPVQFKNKLRYPTYLIEPHAYDRVGVSRQMTLFPFNAVQFPLKLVHFTLVLQIVWVMMFLLNYSGQLANTWECPLIFAFGLFLIMFQLFFVIPFFLKKYAIATNIQQLKDATVISKVVANQKEKVTLAFARFYRLLKHLRRDSSLNRKNQLKLRPEILDQLKEIDSLNLSTIDELAKKLGFKNLSNDELYYLDKAFFELARKSEGHHPTNTNAPGANGPASSAESIGQASDHPPAGRNKDRKIQIDEQSSSTNIGISPNNRHASKKYSGFNPESTGQLPPAGDRTNGKSNNDGIHDSHTDLLSRQPQILLDLPPPLLLANRSSNIGPSAESKGKKDDAKSNNTEGASDKAIAESNPASEAPAAGAGIPIGESGDPASVQPKAENLFVLSNLTKICSVFTEEVTLDPYRTSYDALMGLFDEKEVISYGEFSRMIMSLYKKIEQEQLNLILHINDIRMIEKEVFYLEDKFDQVSLMRISSFIRNAIEMLPR